MNAKEFDNATFTKYIGRHEFAEAYSRYKNKELKKEVEKLKQESNK